MKNLKYLRERKGFSQQKLAEQFDLSQQSIYKYENGKAEPDISTLIKFATFFETSIDYLVGITETPCLIQHYEPSDLSNKELSHLVMYRNVSPSLRDSIDHILEEFNKIS